MNIDILKLYLGCRVIGSNTEANVSGYEEDILETVGLECATFSGRLADYYYDEPAYQLQLLLRPLSSMTEEEFIEVCKIMGWDSSQYDAAWFIDEGVSEFVYLGLTFELTRYLLSKSFDLFGLIEQGLALDSTKTLN